MATDLRQLPAFFDTDATFRTWGTGVAAQLTACGLTQTADTGQINWTTVLKPGAASTMMGFEIYRFSDSLQATAPVFIKIEYGSGTAATHPGFYVQIGSATNGAGALSGQLSTRQQTGASAAKTAGATLPSYCCGSAATGRIMIATNADPVTWGFWTGFCLERVRDGKGVTSGNGVACFWWSQNWGSQLQMVPATGSTASMSANFIVCVTGAGSILTYGSDVALLPATFYLGRPYWSTNLGYNTGQFPALTPITANHLGATHTYLPLGSLLPFGQSNFNCAMLWE